MNDEWAFTDLKRKKCSSHQMEVKWIWMEVPQSYTRLEQLRSENLPCFFGKWKNKDTSIRISRLYLSVFLRMGRKGACWGKTTISPVRIDNLKSPIYRSRPRTVHIKAERSSNNKYSKDEGKKKKKYGRTEREREANPAE